jgi:hypothetical protein
MTSHNTEGIDPDRLDAQEIALVVATASMMNTPSPPQLNAPDSTPQFGVPFDVPAADDTYTYQSTMQQHWDDDVQCSFLSGTM